MQKKTRTARKQENKATLVDFSTSILVSKILYSYQNGKITAKMLIRRSYVTLGATIGVMLLIRECQSITGKLLGGGPGPPYSMVPILMTINNVTIMSKVAL